MFFKILIISFFINLSTCNYPFYSTKTSYDKSFSDDEVSMREDIDEPWVLYAQDGELCTPLHMSAIIRHGSRNPSEKYIKKGNSLMEKIRGHVTNKALLDLNHWNVPFLISEARELINLGKDELRGIAKRMNRRFKRLFKKFSSHNLEVYSSNRSRTLESSKEFILALGENMNINLDDVSIHVNDKLLRFFDHCKKYELQVKKNADATKEYSEFSRGKTLRNIANAINKRLGLRPGTILPGDLKVLFSLLAVEEAMDGFSLWRKVFTDEEIKALDYLADLKQFWLRGYGHEINYLHSCPLLKKVIDNMQNSAYSHSNGTLSKKVSLYFGHAETMIPLLCLLGVGHDENFLTAERWNEPREFRAGKLSPLAANLAFVLYECERGNKKTFKVQTFLNELPLTLSVWQCTFSVCKLEQIVEGYKSHSPNCDFDSLCQVNHHDEL